MNKITRVRSALTVGVVLLLALSLTWIFFSEGKLKAGERDTIIAEDIEKSTVNIN